MGHNIAILAHVGTAKCHLLRSIALYKMLADSHACALILPDKAKPFVRTYFPDLDCHWITWPFGHNDVLQPHASDVLSGLQQVIRELDSLFSKLTPDLVLGVPGFPSSFMCKYLGVPHKSLLHGSWLLPEYKTDEFDEDELPVLHLAERALEILDVLASIYCSALGYKYEGYDAWMAEEDIVIAQDFNVSYKRKRPSIGFLHTNYGPINVDVPNNCISITFGTVLNPINDIFSNLASELKRPVLFVGGDASFNSLGVYHVSSVSGDFLAQRSSLAINHSGIGTISCFSNAAVRQIFLPHDVDAALTALLAEKSGYGTVMSLNDWKKRGPFGRRFPLVESVKLRNEVGKAFELGPTNARPICNDKNRVRVLFENQRIEGS